MDTFGEEDGFLKYVKIFENFIKNKEKEAFQNFKDSENIHLEVPVYQV